MRSKRYQLEERIIKEKRQRYFDEADRLRALGKLIEGAFPEVKDDTKPSSRPAKAQLAIRGTTSISEFMHKDDLYSETQQENFVDMVFEYLAHRPANIDYIFKDIVDKANNIALRPVELIYKVKNYRCLFGYLAINQYNYLTKHLATCYT